PLSLTPALLRFVISIISWLALGLGFWWMLFSKNKATWHDTYSESIVIQLPKGVHKK
ncbi:MAG: RDD family protein, partial [Thiopseudomonas sp.]